jgi:hypothetical protein
VRNGHDRATTAGEGRVEVVTAVDGHAPDQFLGGETPQEKELHEHAPIVLERATGDSRNLRG